MMYINTSRNYAHLTYLLGKKKLKSSEVSITIINILLSRLIITTALKAFALKIKLI